jgi:hypothetical protein
MEIVPNIKLLTKHTNSVKESDCGKNERKAVATHAMKRAKMTERYRGLSIIWSSFLFYVSSFAKLT